MKESYIGKFILLPKKQQEVVSFVDSVYVAKKHIKTGGKVKVVMGELEHIFDNENEFDVFCSILSN